VSGYLYTLQRSKFAQAVMTVFCTRGAWLESGLCDKLFSPRFSCFSLVTSKNAVITLHEATVTILHNLLFTITLSFNALQYCLSQFFNVSLFFYPSDLKKQTFNCIHMTDFSHEATMQSYCIWSHINKKHKKQNIQQYAFHVNHSIWQCSVSVCKTNSTMKTTCATKGVHTWPWQQRNRLATRRHDIYHIPQACGGNFQLHGYHPVMFPTSNQLNHHPTQYICVLYTSVA
jgi:hypothetical protein